MMNKLNIHPPMSRNMILWLIFILHISYVPYCFSQTEAQKLFANQEYFTAVSEFEKIIERKKSSKSEKAEAEAHLGMCYYFLNKPKEAVSWIKKGISHGYQTAEVYCIQGLAHQKLEQYKEALAAFDECLKLDPSYPNIDLYKRSCEYALANPQPNTNIKLRSSKINTEGSEYGLSPIIDNEIFFSLSSAKGQIDPRTGLGFSEIYSTMLKGNELTKPKKEKTFTKAYYNSGIFAYDSISNNIYLTICDPKSGRCGIYESSYNRGGWGKPEPLFISDQYDMAHPALAKNGRRLFFVSNSGEGNGMTDIWYIDRINDTEWSQPVNAGNVINTSGREEFPFVEGDSLLFFASTGHTGFGGLDLFASSIKDDKFGEPKNLGRPFNSGADDFNLVSLGETGLLVSSRNTKNNDDIYIFSRKDLSSPPPPATEEEPEPVVEPEPEIIPEIIPEPTPEPVYIPAPKPETKPEPKPEPTPSKPVSIRPDGNTIAIIYFDFDRFVPQREYRNQYDDIAAHMKSYPNAVFEIAGYADTRGGTSFNRELSDKRAKYIAKRLTDRGVNKENIVVKGYGYSNPAVPNANTEEEFRKNRRVEIRMIQRN